MQSLFRQAALNNEEAAGNGGCRDDLPSMPEAEELPMIHEESGKTDPRITRFTIVPLDYAAADEEEDEDPFSPEAPKPLLPPIQGEVADLTLAHRMEHGRRKYRDNYRGEPIPVDTDPTPIPRPKPEINRPLRRPSWEEDELKLLRYIAFFTSSCLFLMLIIVLIGVTGLIIAVM